MSLHIVTANRLGDGRVVYLADGGWSHDPAKARIAADDAAAEALLALGRQGVPRREVVDPYLIEVVQTAAGPYPASLRERIRSAGPTIRTDLGYQAGEAA